VIEAPCRSARNFFKSVLPENKVDFRQRLTALDGLRGFAVISVFFYHYARAAERHSGSLLAGVTSQIFGFGWSGVDLFFVLSGFLITGILYDTVGDAGYYKKFYARRALRIFPIYYLLVLIFLLIAPILNIHWQPQHLAFLVYLGYPAALIWPTLVQVSPLVAITHLWSLSVEEQFYLIWPWAIARLREPRVILRCCLAIVCASLGIRAAIVFSGSVSASWAYAFLLCRMDSLGIGAALAILVRGPWRLAAERWSTRLCTLAALLVVAICLWRGTVAHDDSIIASVGLTVVAVMYGGLLLWSLKEGSFFSRFFSTSILRAFGRYSYGLYLYHFPLTVLLGPLKGNFIQAAHSYVLGATAHVFFNLAVNFLIAAISFHLFEQPIMRLKDRFKYSALRPSSAAQVPFETGDRSIAPAARVPE